MTKNVAGMVTPPRSRKKEIRTLTPGETKRLLKEARGRGWRPFTSSPGPRG